MEESLCSKHCLTCDSSDYLTYKTKQNLNFPFILFPIYLCPTSSLIKKKKRTGVKTTRTIENTYMTSQEQGKQKSCGFLECAIFQLIGFLH